MQVGVLAGVQAEHMVVDSTNLPKEEEQEERTCDDIEDTVPDHLARGVDHVRTLRKSPTDGVGDEHECEIDRGEEIALLECTSLGERATGSLPQKNEPVELCER